MSTYKLLINLTVILLFSLSSIEMIGSDDHEVITTIILINRTAELVDVNSQGEILQRHITVPDYFSSRRSHKALFGRSMNKLKNLGFQDHFLPNSSSVPANCLQSFIVSFNSSPQKELSCLGAIFSDDLDLSMKDSVNKISQLAARKVSINSESVIRRKDISLLNKNCSILSARKSSVLRYTHVLEVLDVSSTKKREPLRHRIV